MKSAVVYDSCRFRQAAEMREKIVMSETDLLDIPNVLLTAAATATLRSSSASTQRQIWDALRQLDAAERRGGTDFRTIHLPETGRYVSQAGDSRIVWTRDPNNDRILVLSIFIPSP